MNYIPPTPSNWTGRSTPPGTPPDYWYQTVKMLDMSAPERSWPTADYAILGYAVDEGVRRNQGRMGAAAGANAITKKLGGLANHLNGTSVADAGHFICPDGKLEATQMAFGNAIHRLLERGITPIALGGGHDIAYAHFLGLHKFTAGKKKIGILNFDAHFDLRPFINGSTSGTPFRQIMTFHGDTTAYFALGIQKAANPPSLFRAAEQLGVDCITHDACTPTNVSSILHLLHGFLDRVDYLYLTVDLDGFSSAYAPGVSAPSPVGFSPEFFFPVFKQILASGKVLSVDIAEYNPTYDQDGVTAKLAARVVEVVACHPTYSTPNN